MMLTKHILDETCMLNTFSESFSSSEVLFLQNDDIAGLLMVVLGIISV